MTNRETIFSPCRRYRYTLWREWGEDLLTGCADDAKDLGSYAMFIGLNPSTADETLDDPTIRRCVGFAKSWGYSALCMTNLFALRATDPKEMISSQSPVGESNLHCLLDCAIQSSALVAAWGIHGGWMDQDKITLNALSRLSCPQISCLGVTKSGFPKHPLYLPRNAQLRPFV